ncbi:hypothetical protein [Amycolatopsis sp. NPDC051128]|uniref:hypothetical protein n=1 Tax=Amycolatopsis sp. NPDC051128 TaxID=3155412 RepID=UPI003421B26F
MNLQVGDHLQTAGGGEADVVAVTPYHSIEVTYDLTIDELHTYYVLAGDISVLVHNCGGPSDFRTRQLTRIFFRDPVWSSERRVRR